MNVGISVPLPAYDVDVASIAKTAETLGFESLWCAEHPIMPVDSKSRFPGSADSVIPESYSHFVDPFVALARVRCHQYVEARDGHHARSRAQPAAPCQGDLHARSLQRRAVLVRHRHGLAP